MEKREAEAIRRGWLYPRPVVRYEDVQQNPTRNTRIVTFKDWLDSRPGRVTFHSLPAPEDRTGVPMTLVHFDEVSVDG